MRTRYQLYGKSPSRWPWVLVIAAVMAAATVWFLGDVMEWLPVQRPITKPLPLPGAVDATANVEQAAVQNVIDSVPVEEPEQEVSVAPALPESDLFVRDELLTLARWPAQWLAHEDVARSWMRLVNDLAQRQRGRFDKHIWQPEQPFQVEESKAGLFIAAASYQRYTPWIEAIEAIDVEQAAKVWRRLRPVASEAFVELGYPEQHSVDDLLKQAISVILSAPVVDRPIEVAHKAANYRFVEAELEQLNPVHKLMLRLGPDNTLMLKAKLKQFLPLLTDTAE
ncbi:MAG: DUF3014 domain-containing protein [Methylococcales bacterium]|nr:DUF3014 domain-containing protein [Methylococcales bacterium]